jgi:hypothetical protein
MIASAALLPTSLFGGQELFGLLGGRWLLSPGEPSSTGLSPASGSSFRGSQGV